MYQKLKVESNYMSEHRTMNTVCVIHEKFNTILDLG